MTSNNKYKYKAEAPYPPIQVNCPNLTYAHEMLSNMADIASEMSDISRYFYISVVTQEHYRWISTCFHHISIVEMHHLKIFSELALQLGEDPRLWYGQNNKNWWSPSYTDYPCKLCALVAESINSEKKAINKYSKQANGIHDIHIVKNLKRIILDEEIHLQTFTDIYQQLSCS